MDPDWPGNWWWLVCTADGAVVKDVVAGCPVVPDKVHIFAEDPVPAPASKVKGARARGKDEKETFWCWRDISAERDLATGSWRRGKAYWNDQAKRVVEILAARSGGDL